MENQPIGRHDWHPRFSASCSRAEEWQFPHSPFCVIPREIVMLKSELAPGGDREVGYTFNELVLSMTLNYNHFGAHGMGS